MAVASADSRTLWLGFKRFIGSVCLGHNVNEILLSGINYKLVTSPPPCLISRIFESMGFLGPDSGRIFIFLFLYVVLA